MSTSESQAEAFHHEMVQLIKKYQFRDRNQMTCRGVSVSQCYVLEILHFAGTLTMQSLADQMYLSISTVTRVVDGLIKKGFVKRTEDKKDRRVRHIALTDTGEAIFQTCWSNIMESEKTLLEQFPAQHRDMLVEFLSKLNEATTHWQTQSQKDCNG